MKKAQPYIIRIYKYLKKSMTDFPVFFCKYKYIWEESGYSSAHNTIFQGR